MPAPIPPGPRPACMSVWIWLTLASLSPMSASPASIWIDDALTAETMACFAGASSNESSIAVASPRALRM